MPEKKNLNGKRPQLSPKDPGYDNKRAKNNEAVKKSREKTKAKAQETVEKVNSLRRDNEILEERIKILSKELIFLKDIFMAHASSAHGLSVDDLEIKALLEEDDDFMEERTRPF